MTNLESHMSNQEDDEDSSFIAEEAIDDMLDDINFFGSDSGPKESIKKIMIDLVEEYGLRTDEVKKFIIQAENSLERMSKYLEQFPPVELVQGAIGLITTGDPGHFVLALDYDANQEAIFNTLQSLAANIQKERESDQ